MMKHSLNDKRRARNAAKRLLFFLNMREFKGRGTVVETVSSGDEPPLVVSERDISNQQIAQLKVVLTTLNELQQRARKGRPVSEADREPVNQALARYHYFTQLEDITSEQAIFRPQPVGAPADDMGREFALHVVTVAQHGMLGRVRSCLQCHKWFLAPRRHSLFCNTAHQQKYWRSLPEVKAKTKKYQRDYYRDHLSPVTRILRGKQRRKAS
jgi:hypothetical protein